MLLKKIKHIIIYISHIKKFNNITTKINKKYNKNYHFNLNMYSNIPLQKARKATEKEFYRKIKLLGEGSFGKAFLV